MTNTAKQLQAERRAEKLQGARQRRHELSSNTAKDLAKERRAEAFKNLRQRRKDLSR